MPTRGEDLIHDIELRLSYSGHGFPGEHPYRYDFELTPGRPKARSEKNWGATAASPRDALQQALNKDWGTFEKEEFENVELKLTMTVTIKPDTMPFVSPGQPYPRKKD